jgi:trehalose 6-phosphate synthase
MRLQGNCWVGWTGTAYDPRIENALKYPSPDLPLGCLVPVFLTETERALFYRGCSNEIIWPLFHDLPSRCVFGPEYWSTYREVNEKFADSVEQLTRRDDFVWVHDYHLMLLGEALRTRDLPARLAYFHHIPFPCPDVFEKLPWRNEVLRALLQFDEIGVQTLRDQENLIACVRRYIGEVHVDQIGARLLLRIGRRCVALACQPVSIDYEQFSAPASADRVAATAENFQARHGSTKIILGVDRLDYTKGIAERLEAFRTLLAEHPALAGTVTMRQVVVPSRDDIPAYKEVKARIEALVSNINEEHGTPDWTPVDYHYGSVSNACLLALYRAAHVALITPLRDGMNLVAKEFCAARYDERGVLVLSEFAGSAAELKQGAMLVNPYDTEAVAAAIHRALEMPEEEQRARMKAIRGWIRTHNVYRWAQALCGADYSRNADQVASVAPAQTSYPHAEHFSAAAWD